MLPLREKTPKRRTVPTKTPTGTKWSVHKPDLRIDFGSRCAYCDSYDGFRHTYFEVDHFIPKDFFGPLGNISLTEYRNLVYSCKFCNNLKRAKWPSQSETIFNVNGEGFVDPCDDLYETHFHRTADGGIMWSTDLGRWMWKEAFQFDVRQQGIKVLYNLNKLRIIIDSLIVLLNKLEIGTEEYNNLKGRIGEFTFQYYKYHKELIEYYG